MELTQKPAVPAGMIETAAGRILPDGGYARLLAALDEAHEVTDHVVVTFAGTDPFQFFTGDHLERDASLHFGPAGPVLPDSTIPGTEGTLAWCGGHTVGNRRLERFNHAGTAMKVEWTDERITG